MVGSSLKVQAYVVIKNSFLHEQNECDFFASGAAL